MCKVPKWSKAAGLLWLLPSWVRQAHLCWNAISKLFWWMASSSNSGRSRWHPYWNAHGRHKYNFKLLWFGILRLPWVVDHAWATLVTNWQTLNRGLGGAATYTCSGWWGGCIWAVHSCQREGQAPSHVKYFSGIKYIENTLLVYIIFLNYYWKPIFKFVF